MAENEVWKNVVGYNKYLVSSYGRIKNLDYKRSGKDMMLSPGKIRNGYLVVVLSQNAVRKTCLLHRLIAEAFIPNPNHLPQVNHKDGNKTNNYISNLEWVTRKENVRHSFDCLGRVSPSGKSCSSSKPVVQYLNGIEISEYSSIREAHRLTNIPSGNISKCCKGIRKIAGGFKWRFKPK